MRVLHVIPAVAPRYGGPSTALWPMTSAIARQPGIANEILTMSTDGPYDHLNISDLPRDIVTVHLTSGLRSFTHWFRSHIREYDLINIHTLWNLPTAVAAHYARRVGRPYILRPCGMLSAYSWQRRWAKKRAYWWAVERRNVLGASAFHATSPGELHDIRAAGVSAPVFDIPLGLESAAFSTPRDPDWLRQQCGPTVGDRPIALFLSRLHPKKGVTDILIPAFASVKCDAFLAIVGSVDDSTPRYGEAIREAVAKHRLTDRVGLLGPVPVSERWAAFDGAAVFVLPSHSENFGLVVTEAMARGCAVIVTDQVQSHEHVTASDAGVVVPVNTTAVAAALDAMFGDQAGTAARGEAGQRHAQAHFNWDRIAPRITEIYRVVLAGLHSPEVARR